MGESNASQEGERETTWEGGRVHPPLPRPRLQMALLAEALGHSRLSLQVGPQSGMRSDLRSWLCVVPKGHGSQPGFTEAATESLGSPPRLIPWGGGPRH